MTKNPFEGLDRNNPADVLKAAEMAGITRYELRKMSPMMNDYLNGNNGQSNEQEEQPGVISDLWSSFGVGAGNLVKAAGSLYGLATGDMDNGATRLGGVVTDYWQKEKSNVLKELEQGRKEAITNSDSELGSFGNAIWETVSNPRLFASFVSEQIPMFVAPGGAGAAGARAGTSYAAKKGTQVAAQRFGSKVGTGVGVGVGAVMQGGDVGANTYDDLIALPEPIWEQNPEYLQLKDELGNAEAAKEQIALSYGRKASAIAGTLSIGSQFIPGGATIEKAMAGNKFTGGLMGRAAKGFAGEGAQEIIEEGGGKVISNSFIDNIDENQGLFEGVGESSGLGLLGGGVMGGTMAAISGAPNIESTKQQYEAKLNQLRESGKKAVAEGDTAAAQQIDNDFKQTQAAYTEFLKEYDPGFVSTNLNKQQQAKADKAAQGGDALDQELAAAQAASTIADDVAKDSQVKMEAQQGLMGGMNVWQPNFTMPGSEQEQAKQVDGEYIANTDFPNSVPLGNTLGFDESVGAIDAMPENRINQSDTIFTGEQREELPAPQRLGLPDKYTNTIQAQDLTAELDAQEQMRQSQNAPRQIEQKDDRYRVGTERATIRSNGNPFPTVKSVQASRSYRDAVESGITPEIVKVGNGFGWETNDDIEAVEAPQIEAPINEQVQPTVQEEVPQRTTSLLDTGRIGQSERPTKAITPQGREVGVEYRVVDASQVINSNDENGVANPDFPQEYQNRNRSRSASTQQIRNIANKLNPEQVDYGNMSTDGAPIVSQDGIVESGNGRVAGIKLAYKQGKANAYREYLEAQGYDTEGLQEPVLVRVRTTDMTPEERRQFVTESNERTTLSLSATEKAKDDANIISRIATDFMGGDVDNVANAGFVRKFMQGISSTEAAELTDAEGRLSQTGKRRIEAALLFNAYGDERVVTDLFESSDNDIKSIGGALLDNAGQWAKMRQQAPTELDLTNNVIEAVNLVKQARREGRSVQELVGQQDIFSGEIPAQTERALKMMYGPDLKRAVSRKALSEKLTQYATLASNVNPEPGLFGEEVDSVTSNDLMDQINGTESTTQDNQSDLFNVEDNIGGRTQGESPSGNDTLTEDNQSLREPESQEVATQEPPESGFFTPDESETPMFRMGDNKPSFLFAGEKSQTANAETLSQAKQMDKGNRPGGIIWRDTGWFKDVDGKWKSEIDDSQSVLNDEHLDVMRQVSEGDMAYALAEEVLEHEGLFNAYPQARYIPIEIKQRRDMDGAKGYFSPNNDYIAISEELINDKEAVKSTLLHEIQHWIQERENFAKGGSANERWTESVKRAVKAAAENKRQDTYNFYNENVDSIKEAEKAAEKAKYAMLYKDMKKLIEYAHHPSPTGIKRHIANIGQWLYHKPFVNERGGMTREAHDIDLNWYNLPKRHKKQERARFLRDQAMDMANLFRDTIPTEYFTEFENDKRKLNSLVNALEREASKKGMVKRELMNKERGAARAERYADNIGRLYGYGVYKALAGEVEARNVQTRIDMTAEERANKQPSLTADVRAEEQIVTDDYGRSISSPELSASLDTNPTTTGNRAAISSTDANKVIDSIISSWTGGIKARRNEFVVAPTFDDLPSDIKDAAKQQGAEGKVYGVFHNGKTYVVLDKHNSTQELETTIFHETYGHHGMRKLFGNEITQKMNQLFVANGGISGLRKTAEKHGIDLSLYERGTEKAGMSPETRNRVLMEELLAHMQQDNKPSVKRMAKEVVGYIRQKLRDLGFAKLANVSDSDLFYILKQSRDAVRKGSAKGGDTRFMVVKASREMDQSGIDKVRKAAEAIVNGGYFKKTKINLGETPKVLQLLGASNADFMFDPTKLFDTVKPGRKHELTVEQAVEAIRHIADPVAVFDSITHKGSKVVLTEVMGNNAPVVAAIHIGQDGALQSVNKLASVYAKTGNFNKWINESISQSETIYVNKQKRQALESEGAVQFRLENSDSPLGEFNVKIVDENDLVKFEENSTPLFRTMDDSAPQSFTAPVEKKWSKDWFKRQLQDKFAPIKDMQASIEKVNGQELPEDQNTYRAEELFYGKTENDLVKMEENHVKPLVDAMTQNNIESGELDQYLMAKHARERNAYIASINPEMPDGGSGMTNAEAAEILSRYEQEGKLAGLSIAANEVYKITKKRRQLLRESGLEDEALLDVWDAGYQFYVPLKGFANDSEGNTIAKTGKGFDIRGKESMKAMGRRTMAESPTAHAIQDLSATIIRARKNEVAQTFLNMVESNPNPEIWEVFTDENPDTFRHNIDGEVRSRATHPEDGRLKNQDLMKMRGEKKDDYFAVKVDGKTKYIKLKDKDGLLMEAMKNMGPAQVNGFTKAMGAATRWLSMVNTSLNPEFTITNFTRDIQTALFNALAEQDLTDGKVKDKQIAGSMVKGTGKAVGALYKHARGKLDQNDPMYTWIEEFLADGAKTGYFDSKDVDQIGKDMSSLLDMTKGTNKGKLLKAKKTVGDFVENINGSIENGVRLSAYIEARRAGVTRNKAASFAKNLSVNFNRKGSAGTFLNSVYMFFNAAVQGNVNFARAILTPKVDEVTGKKSLNKAQKIAAGIVGASFGWASLMREIGGEDEDGVPYWDKIPKGVRERSFVILKPGTDGEYFKIPLPYGYNIFYNIGDAMEAAVQSDTRTKGDLAAELALSAYASFIPLGSPVGDNEAESAALVATPTLFKPIVEIATNKNFFGGQIYRENMPYGPELRDSQMSMRSTGEMYKGIARWMNDVMGDGMKYKVDGEAPLYDISPDTIEHIVEFGLGGLYRFGSRMADTVGTVANGGDLDVTSTPFIRQVNGEIRPYEDISNFYDARQELKNIEAELKSRKGKARMEFMQEYRDKYRLRGLMSSIDKRMKLLRKQRDRIEIDDSLSFVEREERLQRIEDKMKSAVATFNEKWNETE